MAKLRALSLPPCGKACSFRSMTSFCSHFNVEVVAGNAQHVTYDCGVAELHAHIRGKNTEHRGTLVELVRVSVLKDIIVLNYGPFNIVVMVVSWVAKDTSSQPRMRRDAHGFWMANLATLSRVTSQPYLLPVLASQVKKNLRGR